MANPTLANKAKKFARAVLASTCLTVGAQAASLTEGTDFSNSFAFTNLNTLSVSGSTNSVGGTVDTDDHQDYVRFVGLLGGGAYTLTLVVPNSDTGYTLRDSSSNLLSSSFFVIPSSVSGFVPTDGILVLQMTYLDGLSAYSATLDAAAADTPEPASLGLTGLGLAAATLASRRKR